MTLNTVAWRQLFSEFFVYFFLGINLGNSVVPKPTKLWISPPLPPTCQRYLDPLDHSTFGFFSNKNGSSYIKENLSQIEGMWGVTTFCRAFSVLGWFPSTFPGYPNCWVVTSKLDQNFHGLSLDTIQNTLELGFCHVGPFFFRWWLDCHPQQQLIIWQSGIFHHFGKNIQHTSSLSVSAFSWVFPAFVAGVSTFSPSVCFASRLSGGSRELCHGRETFVGHSHSLGPHCWWGNDQRQQSVRGWVLTILDIFRDVMLSLWLQGSVFQDWTSDTWKTWRGHRRLFA